MFESIPKHNLKTESLNQNITLVDSAEYSDIRSGVYSAKRAAVALLVAFGINSTEANAGVIPKDGIEKQQTSVEFKNIEAKTGISFEHLANFCNVKLQVKAKEGAPYIFHIGQSHKVDERDRLSHTDPLRREVTDSQATVSKILEHLIQKGITGVFVEGLSDEVKELYDRDKGTVVKLRSLLNQLGDDEDGFEEFQNIYEKLLPRFKSSGEKSIHINVPLHHIVFLMHEKLKSFDTGVTSLELVKNITRIQKELTTIFPYLGQPDTPFYQGAAMNFYLQNQIDIFSTSTPADQEAIAKFSAWQAELAKKNEIGALRRAEFEKFKIEYKK